MIYDDVCVNCLNEKKYKLKYLKYLGPFCSVARKQVTDCRLIGIIIGLDRLRLPINVI